MRSPKPLPVTLLAVGLLAVLGWYAHMWVSSAVLPDFEVRSPEGRMMQNLKGIYYAIKNFAQENEGKDPASLAALVPKYISLDHLEVFFDPRLSRVSVSRRDPVSKIQQVIEEKGAFRLSHSPANNALAHELPDPSYSRVVAYELPSSFNDDSDGKRGNRIVLFEDGSISMTPRERCEKLGIEYAHEQRMASLPMLTYGYAWSSNLGLAMIAYQRP